MKFSGKNQKPSLIAMQLKEDSGSPVKGPGGQYVEPKADSNTGINSKVFSQTLLSNTM